MTTTDTQNETRQDALEIQRHLGDLAESARRHLAYVALAEQIATSENALQQILDVIESRRATARRIAQEEKTHGDDDSG